MNSFKRAFCFIVLTSLFSLQVAGQKPLYRNYSIGNGLPSSEIYHVFQDSKNYIWLATNMGVSRFDGREFKTFDVQNGLPENTVFETYEDVAGRIWFIGFPFQLAYFKEDSIYKYKYNDLLRRVAGKGNVPVKKSLFIDKDDELFFSLMRGQAVYHITPAGRMEKITQGVGFDGINVIERHGSLFYYQSGGNAGKNINIRINIPGMRQDASINRSENYSHGNIFTVRGANGELFVSMNDYILKVWPDGRTFMKKVCGRVIWLEVDSKDDLWIGTEKCGAVVFNKGNLDAEPANRYLTGFSVSAITTDKEGGKWFATFEDGVYYLASENFTTLRAEDGLSDNRINCVAIAGNKVVMGTNDNYINVLKEGKIEQHKITNNPERGIRQIEPDQNNNLWISNIDYLYYYDWKKVREFDNNHDFFSVNYINSRKNFNIKGIYPDKNGMVYLGEGNGMTIFDNGKVIYNSFLDDDLELRVESVRKMGDSLFMLGTLDGLWLNNKGKYEYLGLLDPMLKYRITDLKLLGSNGSFVIGTKGYGVVIHRGGKSINITSADGLTGNSVTSLCITDSLLWVATNNGLNMVNLNSLDSGHYKIMTFNKHHGLVSNEINNIAGDKENIYIATNSGLTIFNYRHYKPVTSPPPVYITALRVMARDTVVNPMYRLKYNQNFISVQFLGISYLDGEEMTYKCRLRGLSDEWIKTTNSQIDYAFLPPGKYVFEVLAVNSNGLAGEQPAAIAFTILRPYWKTWWFIALMILMGAGLIVTVYLLRMKQVKEENTLRNDLLWYRQQALSKQMDPHFVFNTLNSIQSYIINNDRLMSSQYLAKFAKLMRQILNNSQHQAIPLSDELSAIRIYLELESLRFQQKFNYDINIDPDIQPELCYIPAFLIQPFVENAIWHGIMGIDRVGYLKIDLIMNPGDEYITCMIEDNGKGRKQSMAEKTEYEKGRSSVGISLINSRLKLLNSFYGTDMKVVFTDLYDEEGKGSGTRVQINLPLLS